MLSLNHDYKSLKTELCDIGAKYDTDSSSQRFYVTPERHCHPYTIFYHSQFKHKRDSELTIAEIGVGGSTRMWREYFKNSTIYGFDINAVDISGVVMTQMDVTNDTSIKEAFSTVNQMYDLIIEDTTHYFDDQVRVIKTALEYLKPGGMLVLQSVYKNYEEWWYTKLLSDVVLEEFQHRYFLTFKHERQCSLGWDNDKILVLVKNGDTIFKQQNKITIITPSIRPHNLPTVCRSINFDYVHEWIIVYDGSKISENPNVFINEGNPKIKEYLHLGEGISGNPQRNYALDHVEASDTYLYFLDDDNVIDSRLYGLLNIIDDSKMYTFGQTFYGTHVRRGNIISVCHIDTAMVLIDFKLCKDIRWRKELYDADGYYIVDCYENSKDNYIFVDNVLTVYNCLV